MGCGCAHLALPYGGGTIHVLGKVSLTRGGGVNVFSFFLVSYTTHGITSLEELSARRDLYVVKPVSHHTQSVLLHSCRGL